jgi:hypothetical protein
MFARQLFSGAAIVLAVIACGSGSGPLQLPNVEGQRDQPPSFLRDDPNADGGSSRDDPGPGQQSPGTCIGCDQNYHCVGFIAGTVVDVVVALTTRNGVCTSKGTVFGCDGTVVDEGQQSGVAGATWQSETGGAFRLCQQGKCVECTPTNDPVTPQPQPQPQPGGGNSGDGGGNGNQGDGG